ncbi:MAG: AraC family transcriptional regulator [Phototrophicaceae bacterium]
MKNAVRSQHYEPLRRARTFIERHYDQPITLERISREAGFSPFHFIRLFRAVYKLTPHQYLIQCRIAKAKQLLQGDELNVTEICYAVGFESLGSFSTLFRRTVGLTPSAYRKSAQDRRRGFIPQCFQVKLGIGAASDG